jgi:predicted TIM-barrel fold metal-dependent hydrolase
MAPMVDPYPEPARFLIGLLQYLLMHRKLRPLAKILSAQFTPQGDIKILGKSYHICPDPDNAVVFQTVKENPGRFLGWVFVNPRGKNNPVQVLEQWKDASGFVGVKAHPFWHRFPPMELVPVAERLATMGKPLLIHVGFGAHGDFEALLNKVPGLKLILAHAGFPQYSDTWSSIRDRKDVSVDLSQTSYVGAKTTREVVAFLGVKRCLYGTDGPFGFQGADGLIDYGFIKNRIETLFPDKGVQARLLGQNFAELVGIH